MNYTNDPGFQRAVAQAVLKVLDARDRANQTRETLNDQSITRLEVGVVLEAFIAWLDIQGVELIRLPGDMQQLERFTDVDKLVDAFHDNEDLEPGAGYR